MPQAMPLLLTERLSGEAMMMVYGSTSSFAVVHKEGVVLNQKKVDAKTNEIKLVKPLLKDIPLEDAIITGDALTYPVRNWPITS